MNVPFTKQRVNESIFHASAKGYNNSANGVEAAKVSFISLFPRKKRRPDRSQAPHAHEFVASRLLAIELADSNALAVLVNVTKVANAHGLGNVGAGSHSELHGLLDVVAIPVPLVQERSEGAIASADGRDQLDVELTLGVPDVLAVGEVGVAAATTSEQHVLDAGVVGELHGNADLVRRCSTGTPKMAFIS